MSDMNDLIIVDPTADAVDAAVAVIQTALERAAEIPPQVIRAGAVLAVQVAANPNPLAGELYIYPIAGKWTPYLGIAYYRRIAEERGARVMFAFGRNGSDEPRAMTPEERIAYGVPDKMDASICKGFRGDRLFELMQAGIPWGDAVPMITRTGIGYVSDDEKRNRNGQYMNAPTGRSWQWKTDKRAEMDLYRKLGVVAASVYQAEQLAAASAADYIEDYPPQVVDPQPRVIAPDIVEQINRDLF